MGTEGGAKKPRSKRFLWVLFVAGVVGLGVGVAVGRSPGSTVAPLVRDLESAGYVCEPVKKADDGILSSFSACEKDRVRLELSTQPSDQAHTEFVRFTTEDMGCALARSRDHVGFTLYARGRMVVYEFGIERRFAALADSFSIQDVECKRETV